MVPLGGSAHTVLEDTSSEGVSGSMHPGFLVCLQIDQAPICDGHSGDVWSFTTDGESAQPEPVILGA